MDVAIMGILLPIVITLGAFVMVIYIRKYSYMERMALIEKGMDPTIFRNGQSASPNRPIAVLRASLLLIGAGSGLLMGYWLDRSFAMEEVGYFSMLFIFGGVGLGLAYIIEESKAKIKK
jgi:hypothetical protein